MDPSFQTSTIRNMDGGGAAFDFRYGRRASPVASASASVDAVAASIVVVSFLAECSKSSSAFAKLGHATFSEENIDLELRLHL